MEGKGRVRRGKENGKGKRGRVREGKGRGKGRSEGRERNGTPHFSAESDAYGGRPGSPVMFDNSLSRYST